MSKMMNKLDVSNKVTKVQQEKEKEEKITNGDYSSEGTFSAAFKKAYKDSPDEIFTYRGKKYIAKK